MSQEGKLKVSPTHGSKNNTIIASFTGTGVCRGGDSQHHTPDEGARTGIAHTRHFTADNCLDAGTRDRRQRKQAQRHSKGQKSNSVSIYRLPALRPAPACPPALFPPAPAPVPPCGDVPGAPVAPRRIVGSPQPHGHPCPAPPRHLSRLIFVLITIF